MTSIFVTRDPKVITDEVLCLIHKTLVEIVVRHLNGLYGKFISPDNLEARFTDYGPLDIKKYDLSIVVWMKGDPNHTSCIYQRTALVAREIAKFTPLGQKSLYISVRFYSGDEYSTR